ncbi:hypothetical protein HYP71_gp008 [Arthrobacter phage KBurrousTX]|uniref:Uncharacterized protein n=1 Tax=Arthrobacter phage KBurrousTX TaxID=2315608 RepID=A0A386K9Q8_9CAUD|nr:hypothetical protein HYP71_gp008 [Arthrobacter phage KBurrousTX]AYD81502.1 hypothetical protein KBurrousTX_8 [Arthrobacter phage KBurrousTX]
MPQKRGARGRYVYNGGRVRDKGKAAAAAPKKGSAASSGLSTRNALSMTGADKIKAAAIMFGTGSKQHAAAKKKFAAKKGK